MVEFLKLTFTSFWITDVFLNLTLIKSLILIVGLTTVLDGFLLLIFNVLRPFKLEETDTGGGGGGGRAGGGGGGGGGGGRGRPGGGGGGGGERISEGGGMDEEEGMEQFAFLGCSCSTFSIAVTRTSRSVIFKTWTPHDEFEENVLLTALKICCLIVWNKHINNPIKYCNTFW